TAVERKRRYQVEEPEQHVDEGEPGEKGGHEDAPGRHEREHERDQRNGEAHQGSDACDQRLGAGAGGLALQLRHAAEEPQRNTGDLHAVTLGDERVRKFVGEQARIKKDGAGCGDEPVQQRRVAGSLDGEDVCCQRPDEQRKDEDQAPVEPNIDTKDSLQPDACGHVGLVCESSVGDGGAIRGMDNVTLARATMGTSLGFHIVFAVLGVGLPLLMMVAEGLWLKTKDDVWLSLAQRWSKAFGILFAVGAVSGTALSFELGLLWPRFMAFSGAIFGLPFSAE